MADLKLARLPDRVPVKLTIAVSPELKADLDAYAAMYEESYGNAEPLSDLVPAMLSAFLGSDRAFIKAKGRKG